METAKEYGLHFASGAESYASIKPESGARSAERIHVDAPAVRRLTDLAWISRRPETLAAREIQA